MGAHAQRWIAGLYYMKTETDETYRRDVVRCNGTLANLPNGLTPCAANLNDNVAYTIDIDQVSLLPIPEPGTACLLGLGLAGIAWSGRRQSAA